MGSTNFTPNYSLPQFIGTDKPAWLTDVNTAMSNIDTAIKNAADDASSATSVAGSASSAAAAATNSVNTLNSQINTPGTGLAAQVTAQGTALTSVSTKVGTAVLDTVAQDLSGAVNELQSDITDLSGSIKFLGPVTIQETYDGSKTIAQAMNTVYAAFNTAIAALNPGEYVRVVSILPSSNTIPPLVPENAAMFNTTPAQVRGFAVNESSGNLDIIFSAFKSNSFLMRAVNSLAYNDYSSTQPASGYAAIVFEKYST